MAINTFFKMTGKLSGTMQHPAIECGAQWGALNGHSILHLMITKHGSMIGSHHIEPDSILGGPLAEFEVGVRQAAQPCCIDAMSCIMAGYVRIDLFLLHSDRKDY